MIEVVVEMEEELTSLILKETLTGFSNRTQKLWALQSYCALGICSKDLTHRVWFRLLVSVTDALNNIECAFFREMETLIQPSIQEPVALKDLYRGNFLYHQWWHWHCTTLTLKLPARPAILTAANKVFGSLRVD